MNRLGMILGSAMCVAGMLFSGCGKAEKKPLKTIQNLQAAYNGENNAAARYEFLEKKVAANGYQSLAALFRAARRAELVHASRQAAALRAYGVEPRTIIHLPDYRNVEDCLKEVIAEETMEAAQMYPRFFATAKEENVPESVLNAFSYALEAEKDHTRLFTDAMIELPLWKKAGKTFYVCSFCGWTTGNRPQKCALCGSGPEKFEEFK